MTATREPLLTAAGVEAVRAVSADFADALMLLATSKKPAVAATTVKGCKHSPPCPTADRPDHDAAKVLARDDTLGYSILCNHVVVFDDTGELVGTTPVAPHRPEPLHCTNPDHGHACPCDPEEN